MINKKQTTPYLNNLLSYIKLSQNIQQYNQLKEVYYYLYLIAHQVKTAGTNNYTYDANGNVIKKNNTTIEYNSNNKPTQLKNQTTTTQFFYNSNKQRYKKILNGNTTFYIGKHYEEEYTQNNTLLKKNYIYAGNELIAIHTTEDDGNLILPQNRYLHKDSLDLVTYIHIQKLNQSELK